MLQDLLQTYPTTNFYWFANITETRLKGTTIGYVGDVWHDWTIVRKEDDKVMYRTPAICTSGEFSNIHTVVLFDADGNVLEEQTLELEF